MSRRSALYKNGFEYGQDVFTEWFEHEGRGPMMACIAWGMLVWGTVKEDLRGEPGYYKDYDEETEFVAGYVAGLLDMWNA